MKNKGIVLFSFIPALLLAGVFGAQHLKISSVASGDLVKGSLPAVYYLGANSKRYVFPNDKVYFSWYTDFFNVKTISDAELASYQLGGNVTYRPGAHLVKIQSDPKVYAIDVHGVLRWVNSESAANAIFGAGWSKKVDDIADAFFINYSVGAPISSVNDYDPTGAALADASINMDKGLSSAPPVNNTNTNSNDNTNTNAPAAPLVCSSACGLGNVCKAGACTMVVGPSSLSVRVISIDSADLCFVGNACSGGNCCSLGGLSFTNDETFKSVHPRDIYQYGDKQQLCDRATISSQTNRDIGAGLSTFSDSVVNKTSSRLAVGSIQSHITGQITMSRISGTCDWWFAPSDLSSYINQQADSSTDAVFVIAPRTLVSGVIPGPSTKNLATGSGVRGVSYSYMTTDVADAGTLKNFSSLFEDALVATEDSAYNLGLYDSSKAIIGNHCRDGKKDFDETGLDCGGAECNACY